MLGFRGRVPGLQYLALGEPLSPSHTHGHTLGLLCQFDTAESLNEYVGSLCWLLT
jgi:hypothetical protein